MTAEDMFAIDKDAVSYIRNRAGSVVIRLMFEPGVGGGCLCSPKRIAGRYSPFISLGKPRRSEKARYTQQQVEGIEVYFPPRLKIREECQQIRLSLGRFLCFRWLKVEGADSIPYCDFNAPERSA
jgi:hypothetical protein